MDSSLEIIQTPNGLTLVVVSRDENGILYRGIDQRYDLFHQVNPKETD
jgi:hypothetical protein